MQALNCPSVALQLLNPVRMHYVAKLGRLRERGRVGDCANMKSYLTGHVAALPLHSHAPLGTSLSVQLSGRVRKFSGLRVGAMDLPGKWVE